MNKRTMWTFLILASISLGAGIHWSLAMLFYDGRLNINAIGEGWIEALVFGIAGLIGFKEVSLYTGAK